MPPNKALELTGRHFGACQALQPPAARFGGRFAGRPPAGLGTFTGGRQLNAVSVLQSRRVETGTANRMRTRAGAALGSFAFFWIAPATVAGLVPWWLTG